MKVLVLGFCRTGTASMRAALTTLGYGPAHHIGRVMADPREVDVWRAAIHAKYEGKGKLIERETWDDMFGDLQVVADVPGILFAEDLIQAYPDAQIIITTRDPDRWWRSFRETLLPMLDTHHTRLARWLDPHDFGRFVPFARMNLEVLLGPLESLGEVEAKRRYGEYYARVRGLLADAQRDSRVLEYQMGDGWAPLCAFLGREVPDVAFPHKNDTHMILAGSQKRVRAIYWRAARGLFIPGTILVLGLAYLLIY
ncbi:P-loop containing nucleoside triphosphate hydrolase protein [Roridomyces roridus]|uniref:P-loop containing nucleoside triphosphate hydrolase protein n=1 Tax=Roridomyces roridus TaxID=1738132 RepID=A0AAD7FMA0_9AGAR|nr:P-loop containing nucleoside triphosphate hydrolase protein [Roridomyces roridus]